MYSTTGHTQFILQLDVSNVFYNLTYPMYSTTGCIQCIIQLDVSNVLYNWMLQSAATIIDAYTQCLHLGGLYCTQDKLSLNYIVQQLPSLFV